MIRITALFILFLFITELFGQNSPCIQQTNQLNILFQKNIELNAHQQIIADYTLVDFDEISTESQAEIRLIVFYAEFELSNKRSFDFSNYRELLKIINSIENIECKSQFLTILANYLLEATNRYPDIVIFLTKIMLEGEELFQTNQTTDIKYNILQNLYNIYIRNENYEQAEIIKKEVEQLYHDPHKKLLILLNDAFYHLTISNFKAAYSKLIEADKLFLQDNFNGKDSLLFISTWAKFYGKLGDLSNQKLYLQVALEVAKFNQLDSDIGLIQFEIDLLEPNLQKRILNFENQLSKYQEIQDINLTIAIMDALANAYFLNNQVDYALKTWENLLILEREYKSKIDQVTLWNLAYGNKKNKNYKDALSYTSDVFKREIIILKEGFDFFSTIERKSYLQSKYWMFDFINDLTIKSLGSPAFNILSYDANLILKSILLETSRELDQAISNSNDSTLKAQFSEIKQLRTIVIQMQSEGSENREVMERYRTQADSLDKILVNSVGEYTASKRKFEITWKDVQLNLSAKDAAIEFARYFDDKDSSYKYMALVVRPDYDYPKLVNLGEERDIRNAAKNRDFSYLYDLIWKDIDTLLNGVQTVYYSPAGELNNISFVAMCFEAGDSVMTANTQKRGVIISSESEKRQGCSAVLLDKYSLQQLTTTRYLADGSLNNNKPLNTSLTLYGGINYDALPLQSETFSNEMTNEDYAFQVNLTKSIYRSETLGTSRKKRSSSSSGKNMDYLPGTLQEVSNISTLMQDNQWLVQTRSDKKAGELILKKDVEIQAPGILHIATHGFSFPDEAKKETSTMHLEKSTIYNASEDPMVRCGLMLSGSNISWTGNPQKMLEQTGEDGILTAAEVANLDLSNTKLVVLSACETGLGKIEGSEGTFGLKRGFKLAGVEQLIVSLWSVPDKETMELMTLFYTDLAQTLNPVISFEKAQKEMRNRYPTEPDKWAGFVLVR
jgi:hypothetical protein